MQRMFSDYNGLKLEINNRKLGKFSDMWKLNNIPQNNQQVNEEIIREVGNI